jgi:lipopolysaccharide transport system permease protein
MNAKNPAVPLPVVRIRPVRGFIPINLRELWDYRELLYFFTWRDIKVRYKQTALGVAWAVLQPFLSMIVFTLIFGRLAGMPSDGIPYPLFAITALLPWQFFSHTLAQASTSLVVNERVITKIYFPRMLVPMAASLGGLMDFAVASVILIGMLFLYGVFPGGTILLLPFFLALALAAALGVGLWLSALDVQYRDVRYTIPFLTQIWFFATPVVYPSSLVPEPWRTLSGLNPMCGVVTGLRWIMAGGPPISMALLITSALAALLFLISGLFFFRRMERDLADKI